MWGRTDFRVQHFIGGLIKILYFKTKKTGKVRKFLVEQTVKSSWSTVALGIPRHIAADGQWSRDVSARGTKPCWLVSDLFFIGFT